VVLMPAGELLPFDDVSRRLGMVGQRYVGIRAIPIHRIVGSVDRSQEFDRRSDPSGGIFASGSMGSASPFRR
jgi:hypothetical protein